LKVEEDNQVLGIAPMMLSKYQLPAFGSIRKIEFLGARHSDYNNFIISEKEGECVRNILGYLNDVKDWDWIELKEIPESVNYSKQLFADSSLRLEVKERVCNQCPYISLPKTFENLKKSFGRNLRQNLNRNLRKIRENHSVDLKRFDEAGFSVKEAMNLFVKLHEMKWKSEGQPGAFAEETFRNFHTDVAELFARNGWLGIYFLMVDGEPVATQYTFEYIQKMYYYLAGFLPKYKNFSVGNLLIMFLLRQCIEKGFTEYDMMRGNEAYKLIWTHECRRNFEVRLVRKKITSELYDWVTWGGAVENIATKLKISLKKTG
jgi:CelD/BcsL family acetyltransferase involved in cellulose biosynthesis